VIAKCDFTKCFRKCSRT